MRKMISVCKSKSNFSFKNLNSTVVRSYCSQLYGRALVKEKCGEITKQLKDELKKGESFSSDQWKQFTQKLLNREIRVVDTHVTEKNVGGVIMRLCDDFRMYSVGQSYYKFIKDKPECLTNATLSRYLSLCVRDKSFASNNKDAILALYKKLSLTETIEPTIAERCIHAVCCFEEHWKDAFNLLEQVKFLTNPTVSSYYAIIEACFKFGDIERGWDMLQYVSTKQQSKPNPGIFIAYIDHLQRLYNAKKFEIYHLERMFKYLDEFQLALPSTKVLDSLETFLFSMSDERWQWSLKESFVTNSAVCMSCRRLLEPVRISKKEFNDLSKSFSRKVIMGSNVFLKSTPQEIEKFKTFLVKAGSYDIVIDGLNVAYAFGNRGHLLMAHTLRSVVIHFVREQKKVMVLGRAHMKTWSKAVMRDIYNNAQVFLAQNLSQDDPFLLYATLRGGENTCFISRDFMRSHLFALEDPRDKLLFRKWLISHQYRLGFFKNDGRPNILPPLPYSPTAQKLPLVSTEICWHVPYEEDHTVPPPEKRETPPKWICIRRIPK